MFGGPKRRTSVQGRVGGLVARSNAYHDAARLPRLRGFWHNGALYSDERGPSQLRVVPVSNPVSNVPRWLMVRSPQEQGVTTQVAVKIRLKRMGKIRAPFYRVVVVDSRKRRDGAVIEEIGQYHPTENPSVIKIDSDRAQYWLSVGAQPSDAVKQQLKVTGDWQKFKGLPGAEGRLQVKGVKDVEADRKAAVESVQNDAEKRRAAAAAAAAEAAAAPDEAEAGEDA